MTKHYCCYGMAADVGHDENCPLAPPQGEREAFEAHWLELWGEKLERVGTHYASNVACTAWDAWQARASLSASTPSAVPVAVLQDDGLFTICHVVYAAPQPAQPAVSAEARDAARLDWLDATNKRFRMGWKVGVAPAGNCSVQAIIMGGQPIREAIDAAMGTPPARPNFKCPVCGWVGRGPAHVCTPVEGTPPADNKENGKPRRKLKPMPVGWTRDALRRAGFKEDDYE